MIKANTTKKPKTRLARQSDLDYAAFLVKMYREQFPCLPYRAADGRAKVRPMTGDDLAAYLECFARHGTFKPAAEMSANLAALARIRYRELRAKKVPQQDAIADVADDLTMSVDAVNTALYRTKSRTKTL